MARMGKIEIRYIIDEKPYKEVWDESINLKYILRVLEFRKAANIQIKYI